jgi:SAM-dependent methyltransferase
MDILSAIKIEEIYRFDLRSLVDISKYLNIWNDLSESKKNELIEIDKPVFEKKFSHLTKEELSEKINDTEFWEQYNDKFVYGEISKSGVNKLSNYLKSFTGNFYDIGSGNGKLLIHLSLITNFENYTGIEIVELRHKYAIKINESISQNVNFICRDVLEVDISDANFIFLDDLMFPEDLRFKVINNIPKDCHYLSVWQNKNDEFIEECSLGVSWLETEMKFYLYKKR